MTHYHPEDRPEPGEQPLRARVPDHIAGGAFSTGVIVMTAHSEFILDFVQNLGRPHQIVARVVMPHNVLPQLVDALQRNIDLYRSRWGDLPQVGQPQATQAPWAPPGGSTIVQPSTAEPNVDASSAAAASPADASQPSAANPIAGPASGAPSSTEAAHAQAAAGPDPTPASDGSGGTTDSPASSTSPGGGARQASAQEIYDDLKIRDELLSGSYANAVMIGHGPHEFSFDFITNFYPNSAVSARVFLAAGQVPRLYDSLRGTWDQLRLRSQPRGPLPPPDSGDGTSPDPENPPGPPSA